MYFFKQQETFENQIYFQIYRSKVTGQGYLHRYKGEIKLFYFRGYLCTLVTENQKRTKNW